MKRITVLFLIVAFVIAGIVSCKSAPATPPAPPPPADIPNPEVGPTVSVTIPELFSPDPDIEGDKMTIKIAIEHSAPIRDWAITVQPNRGQNQATQAQRQEGERTQRQSGGGRQGGRRAAFFEQRGTGTPPADWQWDGKGTSGEMVMSAMDYRFVLSVNDAFGNNTVSEGIIEVDIIVRREGENLRIIVPSIVFPPNSANFTLLSQEDQRANTRIMNMIARSLNKFSDYRIVVEGHANPTTAPNSAARNRENAILKSLSEERAGAVVNQLVTSNNISRERLSATGIGGDKTVAAHDDSEENWKNRRVEFLLIK